MERLTRLETLLYKLRTGTVTRKHVEKASMLRDAFAESIVPTEYKWNWNSSENFYFFKGISSEILVKLGIVLTEKCQDLHKDYDCRPLVQKVLDFVKGEERSGIEASKLYRELTTNWSRLVRKRQGCFILDTTTTPVELAEALLASVDKDIAMSLYAYSSWRTYTGVHLIPAPWSISRVCDHSYHLGIPVEEQQTLLCKLLLDE